jgi:opine dehydrogenase
LIQGNTGGSLLVRRALDDAGCRAEIDVAEMDNYPYSCWRLSPTRIRPIVRKRWLQVATFPGNRIVAVFPRVAPLFPEAVAAPNTLYTGFTNANAMLHVANCVANAGRIESGSSYKFYAEGVTPAVAQLYDAINAERVAVVAALGSSVPTLADWFDRVYGVREATLVETCRRLTYKQRRPLSGDRYAEISRSQVHHGRRPDRPDPDERTGRSGGGEDAHDRRAARARPKHDREGLRG